jgi:ribonuclease Y
MSTLATHSQPLHPLAALSPLLIDSPPLLAVSPTLALLIGLLGILLGAGLAIAGLTLAGRSTLAEAKRRAQQSLDDAQRQGQTLVKQMELDARNEQAARREQTEKQLSEERAELKDQERRLTKREDTLDRKLDLLASKERTIVESQDEVKKREQAIAGKQERLDTLLEEQTAAREEHQARRRDELLRIANLSAEDAKREALDAVAAQVQHEAGQLIARRTEKAEAEARETARQITLQAIQRYASEHTAENTVHTVHIPSDDMKGRVIGREGRNIRAFEKATGADVIVDDTPGIVVVSCFDPVRRAIASDTLRKLLEDGRVHPSRIEEVAEQVRAEMGQRIIKIGHDATIEADIQALHPKIQETMGRLHYRTSYGQNILRHSLETAYLCQVIADELGLDGEMARRCGYLHDIGKAMDHDMEGGHPKIGAEFLRRHGERSEAVLNAVAGHHNDIPSTTPYTPIVMAADAISGARPGARRETLERYVKRLEQLEGIATDMKGVKEAYAIQAGREVRVIVDPQRIEDTDTHFIAREIAKRVSEEMTFPGEIKVTVLREMRTVEYAR